MSLDHLDTASDQLADRVWRELTRAPHDRHHDWRTPILATQGMGQTGPQARTVVLREADANRWQLQIYTDARTPKCAELVAQPKAQLIFWSKRLNWQLRVSAVATVDTASPAVGAAWEKVRQSRAASDYLSPLPPGHVQTEGDADADDLDRSLQAHHLAILSFKATAMDWLALRKDGHRRARLTPDGGIVWLVP